MADEASSLFTPKHLTNNGYTYYNKDGYKEEDDTFHLFSFDRLKSDRGTITSPFTSSVFESL